ncbi:hypothetical protein [Deinococcus maricopensis]|uniref:Uncharacterized protein n=1 Tax=Deinococcus maricopensis (strain DSM 21211 / LMG 22137 / NRRL B-23946 / LB-34) TaxID=709986 RepID=E8U9N3_DEIML|nr:hypothetical protein [Deinococcus maricopensis]ADV67772.1 hypothetical protein Deima_2130 [Deinococcus maricopensis DSM 21211]
MLTLCDQERLTYLFLVSDGSSLKAWLLSPDFNAGICRGQPPFTLRDLDADGVREIALPYGCGDGPGGHERLLVLQLGPQGRLLLDAEVERHFSADGTGEHAGALLTVLKGPRPQVFARTLAFQGYDAASGQVRWTLTPNIAPVPLGGITGWRLTPLRAR